jgi:mannose-1-phosphate guanylyltransferase/mannose-1-phosphate guanylyltransferase/phosphomannomutase
MLLGAGLGTRLRPITYELPKPLVPVLGEPVMGHILRLLDRHEFERVVANIHHYPDMIRNRFGDGSRYGVELSYSFEQELLGTAGGVRNVRDFFGGETFLVISGDALTDIDLAALWARHHELGGIATLALKRVDDPSQLGVVIIAEDGRIQGFQEKPDPAEALSNLGNCGIYVFEPEIFDHFPERDFVDWAQDVFPTLLEQDVPFHGHEIDQYWNDIGSLNEFRQGNFDALKGVVKVELHGTEREQGVRIGESSMLAGEVQIEPPVFVGEQCEIAAGVRLTGPVVIGDGCTIGPGAALREVVLWPRSNVPEQAMVIGAIAGDRPLAERLAAADRVPRGSRPRRE